MASYATPADSYLRWHRGRFDRLQKNLFSPASKPMKERRFGAYQECVGGVPDYRGKMVVYPVDALDQRGLAEGAPSSHPLLQNPKPESPCLEHKTK